LQQGVIRSLEIIREASKNISAGLKEAYPQIQWKMMAAMRDKLIHRYFQVKLENSVERANNRNSYAKDTN
jgi:uncharacterized protein with HEPN domain